MNKRLDLFSARRLEKVILDHRTTTGELPTLTELATAGFLKSKVDDAIHDGLIEEFYVTQTNGVVRKGYKLKNANPF